MTKYQAIFEGETNPLEKLGEKGVLIISLSLDESKKDDKEKIDKFEAGLIRLETAAKNLDLVITNVLNRHNYEIFHNKDEAKKKSLENAEHWEKKYLAKIKNLKNFNKSFSWSDLIENISFGCSLSFVKDLYENDSEFKRRIGKVAGDRLNYLSTHIYNDEPGFNLDLGQALKKIIEYILEECAVVDLLRKLKYDSLFYLGKINAPVEYVANFSTSTADNHVIKLYSISQYKTLKNTSNNHNIRLFNSSDVQYKNIEYLNKLRLSKKVELDHLLKCFFDSPAISEQTKVDIFLKIYNKNEMEVEKKSMYSL